MSDYVPSEEEIAENRRHTGNCDWVELTEREVRRGIARIKADALREALLSDETVERAARALLAYEEGANGVTWEVLGEYERDVHLNAARAALTAAIGDDDE